MITSDRGIVALIAHEGIVPGPYFDSVGVQTYGVGHTASAGDPKPELMVAGMPDDLDAELVRVFDVFRRDLMKYEAEVDRAIKVPVTQHEFDAAVSFHYNTGAISRASWVRALNAGDRAKAIKGIMNWRKPPSIVPRRRAERDMFRSGVYPDTPITVWRVGADRNVQWTPDRTLSPSDAIALLRGAVTPDMDVATAKPRSKAPAVAAGGIAALVATIWALGCKLPLVAWIFNCGG